MVQTMKFDRYCSLTYVYGPFSFGEITKSKARLGCAKMANSRQIVAVCTVAYTPNSYLQYWLPWRLHLMDTSWEWFVAGADEVQPGEARCGGFLGLCNLRASLHPDSSPHHLSSPQGRTRPLTSDSVTLAVVTLTIDYDLKFAVLRTNSVLDCWW